MVVIEKMFWHAFVVRYAVMICVVAVGNVIVIAYLVHLQPLVMSEKDEEVMIE